MPRFTTSDDVDLHYTDAGEGLPVLCLVGADPQWHRLRLSGAASGRRAD